VEQRHLVSQHFDSIVGVDGNHIILLRNLGGIAGL
jgi:hypothetical protein